MTHDRPVIGISTTGEDHARLYVQAVREAGAHSVLLIPQFDRETTMDKVSDADGIILTGGGDLDPSYYGEPRHERCGPANFDQDRFEIYLAREAVRLDMPLLAICRGLQVWNAALGGTLWQDLAAQVPSSDKHDYYGPQNAARNIHSVRVSESSRLFSILGRQDIMVNSSHHQAIKVLATDLTAVAWSPDGVIEVVEGNSNIFAVGVQWHPERLLHMEEARQIFQAFVAAAVDESNR